MSPYLTEFGRHYGMRLRIASMSLNKIFIPLLTLLFFNVVQAADKTTLRFAPLPTKKEKANVEEFLPLVSYLEKHLSLNIDFVTKKDYRDILQGFEDQSIDFAYLGPLPYMILKKEYSHVEPIVTFRQKDGTSTYRCVLAKFADDAFDTSRPLRVALTQPLSTCGYYMSSIILQKKFGIDLKEQSFDYRMSHTNALLSVLKGDFTVAGAKDTIAQRYSSLGMEVIAQSEPLPGFSLVVNTKTLSREQIERIQGSLLSIPENIYKSWTGVISYGLQKEDVSTYKMPTMDIVIPKEGNIR